VRSLLVVVLPPLFDLDDRVVREPVLVQALVAERAIEALTEAVLHRLPGIDEVELHAVIPLSAGNRSVIDTHR